MPHQDQARHPPQRNTTLVVRRTTCSWSAALKGRRWEWPQARSAACAPRWGWLAGV